jgi:fibronectin-binding autotransporter adhesin
MAAHRSLRRIGIASLALALAILGQASQANTYTWNKNTSGTPADGGGTWNTTSANWWSGSTDQAWNNGDDTAQFGVGSPGTTPYTVTLGTGITAGGLIFQNQNYTLAGSNTLTMAGISPGVTVNSASATINANIGGTVGLVKSGTGILGLGGTNSLTGGVDISQGSVFVTSNSALGASSGTITLGDNSSAGPATLQINPGTTATVVQSQMVTGGIPTAENLVINAGSLLPSNTAALATTINLAGAVALTISAGNTGGHTGPQDVLGTITGSGVAAGTTGLVLDGTSQPLRFTIASTAGNNFGGDVVIKGAVTTQYLASNGSGAGNQNIGFLNNNVTVSSGGTWTIGYGGETIEGLNGGGNISLSNTAALNNIGLTIGNNDGSGSFGGVISGGFGVAKVGAGTQVLGGNNTYGGTTMLVNGVLELVTATNFVSNVVFSTTAGVTPDLQLNAPSTTWSFTRQITGGGSGCVIEKTGTGKLTLAPASGSTFVGSPTAALTVTAGTLQLTKPFSTPPAVYVAGGATYASVTTVGPATVAANGSIQGGINGSGSATLASLTFNGAGNLYGSLGGLTTSPAPIDVSGAVTTAGSGTVTIYSTLPSSFGVYHFLQFGSLPSPEGVTAFQLGSPSRSLTLQIDGNYLDVNYSPTGNFPVWTGANSTAFSGGNNWKVNSQSGSVTDFIPGDAVVFNDTAPGTTTVDTSGADVSPGSTTFNNSALSYTLQGSNAISGTGGLTKSGTGLLTITNVNTFTGAVSINGGTLAAGSSSALGAGATLALGSGATLEFTAAASGSSSRGMLLNSGSATVAVDNAGVSLSLSGSMTGSAPLLKTGPGGLTLGGPSGSTYNGTITVSQGTLAIATATALGSTTNITLGDANTGASNPAISFGPANVSIGALTVAANVTGATIAFPQNTATYNYQFNGVITLNSPLNINQSNASGINWSQFIQGNKITGNGGGAGNDSLVFDNSSSSQMYWTYNGVANDFLGNVHIKAGRILMQGSANNVFIPDASSLIIDAGATLQNNTISNLMESFDGLSGGGTFTANGRVTTLTIGGFNGSSTFSGAILSTTSIVKTGTGTQVLSGSNTYSGATMINAGVLSAGAVNALSPNSAVTVNGGTLDVSAASQTISSLTIGSGAALNLGVGNVLTSTGPVSFALGSTLNIAGVISVPELLMTYGGVQPTGSFSHIFNNGAGLPSGDTLSYSGGSVEVVGAASFSGSGTWIGSTNSWSTGGNWVDGSGASGVPGDGSRTAGYDTAAFSGSSAITSITLDIMPNLAALSFSAFSYTLNGGTLTMDSSTGTSVIAASGRRQTIASALEIASGGLDVVLTGSGALAVSGNISDDNGRESLTLGGDGSGHLILSGTNNYGGGTVVNSGTLFVESATALPDGSSLTVGQGALSLFAPVAAPAIEAASGVTAVPEPGTIMLLLVALWSVIGHRVLMVGHFFSRRYKVLCTKY